MIITLSDYWMGRDKLYSTQLNPAIESNALTLLACVNKLLESCPISLDLHPVNKTHVSSGWRPPTVNANTPNAAVNSKHMTGQAVDIYDPDGDLDSWLMSSDGQRKLVELGLWMEHPSATKGWSHLQSIKPRSGNRVFFP